MHVNLRYLTTFVILLSLALTPLGAAHTYVSESAADFTNTSLVNNKIAILVGTLFPDPALPISKININPTISSSSAKMYYTNNNQLNFSTLSWSLYMTYYSTNGTKRVVTLANQNSVTFNSLDMNVPITFHVLVSSSDYSSFLNTVRGFFIFPSENQFIGMGAASAFNLLSSSNLTYPVISNQGESTTATPFVGGGAPGPAGPNTISIGDPALPSSWFYRYNVADQPVYSVSFANHAVNLQNIAQAVSSPLALTSLNLVVDNFANTYLGQSRVTVRMYQAGYPSFRFLHESYPASQLPYTLWVNSQQVPFNIPFSPWSAPMSASNSADVSMRVLQADLNSLLAGTYTTTITVEIISGV